MIPSLIISLIYHDGDANALGMSALATAVVGAMMVVIPGRKDNDHLRLKEGFIITAVGWIMLSLLGAMPFMLSGFLPRFEDAFFESVPFQRLEMEYIDPDAPKKKSQDPRNAF
jgi:trk system potassium uptake protein TrkH